MPEVTRLLDAAAAGDRKAAADLLPLIYDELRKLAAARMAAERPDHSLDATALVHEAFLKLVDQDRIAAESRAHFLGVASRAMRHILCNYARDQRAQKRGGGIAHVALHDFDVKAVMPRRFPIAFELFFRKVENRHIRAKQRESDRLLTAAARQTKHVFAGDVTELTVEINDFSRGVRIEV